MAKNNLKISIELKEEYFLNDGTNFGQVKLFGYVYKLIVKYLMKCKLIKKRKYRFGKQNKVEYQ